jgi:hypothetical protein
MNEKCSFLFICIPVFVFLASCRHNNINDLIQEPPENLPVISNAPENRFLGYKSYISDSDPEDKKWISRVFVYEKYIVNEIAWAYDIAGYVFYENNRKIPFEEVERLRKLFEMYEHYFLGLYDDYVFLLFQGNSPVYGNFIVINLKSGEKIYEGIYVWGIGVEIKDEIEICKYFGENYLWGRADEYDVNLYKYIFHLYSFNLRTGQEVNLNRTIETTEQEM